MIIENTRETTKTATATATMSKSEEKNKKTNIGLKIFTTLIYR